MNCCKGRQSAVRASQGFAGRGFGTALNPLNSLGALTIYFFWIVLVSGIWLFIFFKTSVTGAYESVEYLTHEQWYLGGVMRSLHRYASDAAIITLALHMLKEFVYDRHRGNRWFSWVTGVPLLWLLIPLGITGYWLVWDQLAWYVALTSAELLDWLPIFSESMARNFLSSDVLSDRFFTLMAVHAPDWPAVVPGVRHLAARPAHQRSAHQSTAGADGGQPGGNDGAFDCLSGAEPG